MAFGILEDFLVRFFADFSVQVFLVRIFDLCRFLSWFLGLFQVFKMASRLFQLAFWDFQDFQLAFGIFSGIFSSHCGPLQVSKLVGFLSGILDGQQVVSAVILGFLIF